MYDIWVEGYIATGEHSRAQFLGTYPGESWDEAVQEWDRRKNYENRWGVLEYYEGNWYVWGCQLFDNEAGARKNFG